MNPPSLPVLVAISGGSDSSALLHRLHREIAKGNLFAATVDHGLRPEAAEEALQVEAVCQKLDVAHATLRWSGGKKTAASARAARYDLLVAHAQSLGAATIALGHTMDDQAETVFMRAMRLRPTSNTRGLAGMTACTHHLGVTLWRPLLSTRRTALREDLSAAGLTWIEDPTNQDTSTERVRVRNQLEAHSSTVHHLARFAAICAQSRSWLAQETATAMRNYVRWRNADNVWIISEIPRLQKLVLREVLSVLIMAAGGQPYRPALAKLYPVADAVERNKNLRYSVGRSVVQVLGDTIMVSREGLRRNEKPSKPTTESASNGLYRFRSSADDPIAEALERVLAEPL
ncbi:tRNA lysidine(34) synthetase TilS [Ahrensia sp. R2A130]|uniref:tRNA lysidine(34) synthetase TilS n=1 Tax=Ahrensia sp. R2A130 TaxID=744979 RepID=UPI0001E0B4DF|nr:tRNA lysidine(34) synthetase TilS [Ahrensia sp. R2A130]EFL88729.1 tRNA(Ile)-lysidine synthase [Ahrensia sp. R2A130]